MEEVERISQTTDTDNSLVMARGKRKWRLGGGGQRWGMETSAIVSTIKIKEKNSFHFDSVLLRTFKRLPIVYSTEGK